MSMPAGGVEFVSIAAGADAACVVGDNEKVYCWGSDDSGDVLTAGVREVPRVPWVTA